MVYEILRDEDRCYLECLLSNTSQCKKVHAVHTQENKEGAQLLVTKTRQKLFSQTLYIYYNNVI